MDSANDNASKIYNKLSVNAKDFFENDIEKLKAERK
jgi:hypothetical protein